MCCTPEWCLLSGKPSLRILFAAASPDRAGWGKGPLSPRATILLESRNSSICSPWSHLATVQLRLPFSRMFWLLFLLRRMGLLPSIRTSNREGKKLSVKSSIESGYCTGRLKKKRKNFQEHGNRKHLFFLPLHAEVRYSGRGATWYIVRRNSSFGWKCDSGSNKFSCSFILHFSIDSPGELFLPCSNCFCHSKSKFFLLSRLHLHNSSFGKHCHPPPVAPSLLSWMGQTPEPLVAAHTRCNPLTGHARHTPIMCFYSGEDIRANSVCSQRTADRQVRFVQRLPWITADGTCIWRQSRGLLTGFLLSHPHPTTLDWVFLSFKRNVATFS